MNEHRYYEIDLLRGMACLAVVAFHYLSFGPNSGLMTQHLFPAGEVVARYGYLGVHLFFMISGFVILLSADGAKPRAFLASRVARLYPAFWACATVTALVLWLAGNPRFDISLIDYLINMTMFAHWFGVSYVDGAYWSLAIELHFYLYVFIALRLGWFGRLDWLLACWLLVSGINAMRPMWSVEFWLNAKWAPFFVAGGVFFLIRTRGITVFRISLLFSAYVLAVLYAIREAGQLSVRFSNYAATQGGEVGSQDYFKPEIVTMIVSIFFGIFVLIAIRGWSMPRSTIVIWCGVLTYPVYLLHQNIGYVLYGYLHQAMGIPVLGLLVTLLLVIGFASSVHRWVEMTLAPGIKYILNGRDG